MFRAEVPGGFPAPPPPSSRRGTRRIVAAGGALLGLAVAGAAAVHVIGELTRPPTRVERDRAVIHEVARRWQAWPTGKIFPATLPYTLEIGGAEKAHRVGIDPARPACDPAVEARLAGTLHRYGCRAALRATYLDQLQGLAITVGVVAFPDERSAVLAKMKLPKTPGLRTLALPGSVVARFTDSARQNSVARQAGPYIVFATVGYADGRPAAKARAKQTDLNTVAPQLAEAVLTPLAAREPVNCAQETWSC